MVIVSAITFTIKAKSRKADQATLEKALDKMDFRCVFDRTMKSGTLTKVTATRDFDDAEATLRLRAYYSTRDGEYPIIKDLIDWYGFSITSEEEEELHTDPTVR